MRKNQQRKKIKSIKKYTFTYYHFKHANTLKKKKKNLSKIIFGEVGFAFKETVMQ